MMRFDTLKFALIGGLPLAIAMACAETTEEPTLQEEIAPLDAEVFWVDRRPHKSFDFSLMSGSVPAESRRRMLEGAVTAGRASRKVLRSDYLAEVIAVLEENGFDDYASSELNPSWDQVLGIRRGLELRYVQLLPVADPNNLSSDDKARINLREIFRSAHFSTPGWETRTDIGAGFVEEQENRIREIRERMRKGDSR